MVNLNNYFEIVYVINLDRRKDRYEDFKKEMSKYGIENVERFPAIDGTTISSNGIPLLSGEIGVLLSHLEIIKKCKEEGYKNVLIMEDDVCFSDEIYKIEEYMSSVPTDWDFIYFGGNHIYGLPPTLINDKVLKLNYTVALQCVAINNTMFDVIEVVLPKLNKQVDAYYAEFHRNFNAYGFFPNMAKQTIGFSDIQNRIVDYSDFFKDR
jgi:GR25 family glycosyltransferase involved in LPS biosynthesis